MPQDPFELFETVAALVVERLVVGAPEGLERRHGEHADAAGLQHPEQLPGRPAVVLEVFEHVEREHGIEAPVGEGKFVRRAADHGGPGGPSSGEGHRGG